jgi:tetratricopeptide (TPR) repeat protein
MITRKTYSVLLLDREDKYKSLKSSALFSYNEKVWTEALEGFNQYLEYNPNDIESIFKAGMCNYNLKNYTQAITQFNTVITKGSGKYYDDAEWLKTQSYIKQNNTESAKEMLNQIVSKNGKYKNEAQKLLNELNQ